MLFWYPMERVQYGLIDYYWAFYLNWQLLLLSLLFFIIIIDFLRALDFLLAQIRWISSHFPWPWVSSTFLSRQAFCMVEKLFPGLPLHYQSSYSLLQVLQQKWLSLTITIIITIVFIIILLFFFFIIDY